jgi:uncharacterized protein (DUF1697 family)
MRVALLRGVNVGGKNKLPMKELCALFAAAGCTKVSNYIQSGNIIFEASDAVAKQIPAKVGASIEKQFGFPARLVLRTEEQLRRVSQSNPYLKPGVDEDLLSVMFLADTPSADSIAELDPERSAPDTYIVEGDVIFLCTPTGLARTKLTNAYFDSKLKTFSTARNWRTVLKLLELCGNAATAPSKM